MRCSMEQMSIFDYLERNEEKTEQNRVKTERIGEKYVKHLARCLKIWDDTWNYGYLDKFKESNNAKSFFGSFCKYTTTHFFRLKGSVYESNNEDVYGVRVDKKENVLRFFKCGKDSDKILVIEPIDKLIMELAKL